MKMGLNYNPSSFDTNKTILQAIEELKKYLMTNPLACIYQCHGSVTADLTYVVLTDIVVPAGQEIKAGDIVVAMNGYFNFVDSVGSDRVNFVDNWCNLSLDVQSITLGVDSTNTEIVDTPANFTNWIYRRVPRPNDKYLRGRTYYLVIQYKDSTAFPTTQSSSIEIPANYINAIWYQLNVDNSTTIYFDFTEDPDQQIYQLTNFTIPAGQDGTNGTDGISITGATIDASNHLILTLSDGNTIDAGALPVASGFSNYVEINTTSGTFTNDEYAKLQFNDSVIVYDNGSYKTIYKKKIETSSIIEFEAIDGASRQNLKLIDVNKGTQAFSSTGISMITSSTFDSGTATSGKVLTANGSGGTSWETASGGTTLNKYQTYNFGIITLYNILTGAKGRVTGKMSLVLDGYYVEVPIESTGFAYRNSAILVSTICYSNSGMYIISCYITSSGNITNIHWTKIADNGTITTGTSITYNATDTQITYFNDTQLH